jgi:Tfp pilus assembly PilM family ATPase
MSDDLISALVVRRGELAWTTLRRRKNRLEVAERRQEAFEMPAGVTDLAAPEVLQRLKPLCAQIKGRVAVALPSDQALLRVVRLPTLDAAEIRDMAALQVDKFSPFPIEQMAVSQEVLHQQDGASRVLVAAVQQEHVQKLGNVLRARACIRARWMWRCWAGGAC